MMVVSVSLTCPRIVGYGALGPFWLPFSGRFRLLLRLSCVWDTR